MKPAHSVWLLTVLMLLVSVNAQATGDKREKDDGGSDSNSTAVAGAAAGAYSDTEVGVDVDLTLDISPEATGGTGIHGDVVTEGGRSDAESISSAETGPSTSSTGPVSVVVEDAGERKTRVIKNTPTAVAGDVFPTVSCFKPQINGALSLPGFGISGNKGKIDEGCVKRELIRMAYAMGLIDRAVFMWCKQPEVYEDFGTAEDCLIFEVEKDLPDPPDDDTCTGPCLAAAEALEDEYHEQHQLVEQRNAQQMNLIAELTRRLEATEQQTQEVEQTAVKVDDTLESAIDFRSGQRTKAQESIDAYREQKDGE